MTKARTLADLLDSSGDVKSSALDNATSSLSDLSVTATASELNTLDGITATTAELNYTDGVTSNIQTQIDNIASDLVDDTTPQLGGDLSTNGNDINFGDNDKAQFGAGNSLQIYYDGSSSKIVETGAGSLQLGGTSSVDILSGDLGEYLARFHDDGKVELRHDNAIKLETASHGATVYGGLVSSGSATTTSFNSNGTNTAADSYNYILSAANNGGNRAAMFVNGTTRTADGGANALTFRNDGGKLILGSASQETSLSGSSITSNNTATFRQPFLEVVDRGGQRSYANGTSNVVYTNVIKNGGGVTHTGGTNFRFTKTGYYMITTTYRYGSGSDVWTMMDFVRGSNVLGQSHATGQSSGADPATSVFNYIIKISSSDLNTNCQQRVHRYGGGFTMSNTHYGEELVTTVVWVSAL